MRLNHKSAPAAVLLRKHCFVQRRTVTARVAGIVASPHRLGAMAKNEVPLAVIGIVPCKVSAENGSIAAGDLLVASSTPGYAMKGTDRNKMTGAVVGKALEPLAGNKGMIQVLVTMQ